MNKKETLGEKLERKWNGLSETGKGVVFGILAGIFGASVVAGAATSYRDKKWINAANNVCDQESQKAYLKGVTDGQIKAYRDLLIKSDAPGFKKLGMEVKKF